MTDTIRELEQDIEQTRTQLAVTMDRLQGSLSPSDVVDDLIGPGRPDFGNVLDPVMATIRSHPAPGLIRTPAEGVGRDSRRLGLRID